MFFQSCFLSYFIIDSLFCLFRFGFNVVGLLLGFIGVLFLIYGV